MVQVRHVTDDFSSDHYLRYPKKLWTRLLKVCDDLGRYSMDMQTLDNNSVKAPLDGKCQTGSSPTKGSKNSYEQKVIS